MTGVQTCALPISFRGLVDLEVRGEPIFVLIDIELFDLLDGLLNRYHITLLTIRLQGPGVLEPNLLSRGTGARLHFPYNIFARRQKLDDIFARRRMAKTHPQRAFGDIGRHAHRVKHMRPLDLS